MNILWLSHLMPYPPKGGVKQRSYNLMKEISKYHNLFIICFSQKSHQSSPKEREEALEGLEDIGAVVNVFTFTSDSMPLGGFYLAAKSLFTRDPYTVNWLKKNGVGPAIRWSIDEYDIDLVHFDTISWAAYLQYAEGCKLVLNHHNIESHMMLRRARKEGNFLKKLYYQQEGLKLKSYEEKHCDKFDLNITCSSKDTARLTDSMAGLNVDTIPNGVDLNYFKPAGLQKKAKSMVFAGGLSWYPNIAAMEFFAKKVWPELIKVDSDASMTVIGRNPPQWLKSFAEENSNFNVTGFVDDVRPYIEKSAIYVCPINDGGGTKLKILDALAMGMAIVAHPIACEGIDVIENRHVVYAETPEEYVKKITELFGDDSMRRNLGIHGRLLIEEKYDYIIIGKKLDSLYSAL